jgi:hypothetical protein
MTKQIVSRDEARDLYMQIFGEFASDIEPGSREVVAAINARFQAANSEQSIVESDVNDNATYWQCFQTYDHWSTEQAEAAFDEAWPTSDVEVAVTVRKAKASTGTSAPAGDCRCGCGATPNKGRGYLPGHDARHAGQVARALIADDSADVWRRLLATLPTEALRSKALAQVTRGNAKAQGAKAPTKRQVRRAPEAEGLTEGFVTHQGDLIPAQRFVRDGEVVLNINNDADGSGDWLDSEGYADKTQAYWLKRFVVDAPAKAAPAKPKARRKGKGLVVKGDGPESLKAMFRV